MKSEASAAGLIIMDDLADDDFCDALEIATKKRIPVPARFLKQMCIDTLFENISRKEIRKEIISLAKKPEFEFPELSGWRTYSLPVGLQKALIPNFVMLEQKKLKRWKTLLIPEIVKEIVSIRMKNRRTDLPKKEDPLINVLKTNDESRLSFYKIEALDKERFLSVLPYWLKANDKIKSEMLKSAHVSCLTEEQYINVLKAWANRAAYYPVISEVRPGIFQKLDNDLKFKVIEKFVKSLIEDRTPFATLDEVKQIILPHLLSNRKETEETFTWYKIMYYRYEMKKYRTERKIQDVFSEMEVKQLKIIKKGINKQYHPSFQEMKLMAEFLEWVLGMASPRKEVLCTYIAKGE